MKIIIGSKSIYRQKILRDAGYTFEIMPANIDEKAIRSKDYTLLPLLIARAKAEALIPKIHEPAFLITSDLVVICNGELREKPESIEHAYRYLKSYAQYPAQTYNAVVVTNTQTQVKAEGVDEATVFFKDIPNDVIHELIKKEIIMNAAGGFTIEDPLLSPYVDRVEGAEDSVLGLPMKLTEDLIKKVTMSS